MRIEINTKNYTSSERLTTILEKKIAKFERYFSKNVAAKVILSKTNANKYTMELTLKIDNKYIRSEVTTDNMYDNIDLILPRIEKQIIKYKQRDDSIARKDNVAEEPIYTSNDVIESSKYGKVVKVKNFAISIITPNDAVEEMEMSGHNFYVFLNAETNKVSVVYKRNDGNYGLIDPEY